jgi:cytochrome c553
MQVRRIIKMLLLLAIVLPGCYYDNEETLYPQGECITTDISYAQDIAPLIQQQCYGCHSAAINTGNITLEGHSNFVNHAVNGRLLGAIKHTQGFIAMPQNAPKLSDCNIAKIEQWITDGALNN